MKFEALENSTVITEWTRQMMRNQFEWLFIDMAVNPQSVPHFSNQNQSVLIYTVSVLYNLLSFISANMRMKMSAAPLAGDIHCYRDVKSIPWNITKSVSRAGFSNVPTLPLIILNHCDKI